MRKMATVRHIDDIRPIPNADAIECAVIGGWTVVVKKGDFKIGELAVYCEIDSFIPTGVAPFLTKPGQEPKEYEGVKGERLRSVRLRGQISQGLLIKTEPFSYDSNQCMLPQAAAENDKGDEGYPLVSIGDDVSDLLGIKKYEAPIPAQLAGEVKGQFPSIIPKTDQERIQNLSSELAVWKDEVDFWEVTEKLDGSSMTAYMIDREFGVCSRNLDLKRNQENSLWAAAYSQSLEEILKNYVENNGCNIALQGELIGEGIQGNPYKIKGQKFFLFDVYLINEGRYMTPAERQKFVCDTGIIHVPIIDPGGIIHDNMEQILVGAEGKSVLNAQTEREGLVFKRSDGKASFKSISNRFLLRAN